MVRLYVLDCDGTILNSNNQISSETKKAIKMLQYQGHYVVIASGRSYERLFPILKQLDLVNNDMFCILYNGGLVLNNNGTKNIYSNCFSVQELEEILNLSEMTKTNFIYFALKKVYSTNNYNGIPFSHSKISFVTAEQILREKIYKVIIRKNELNVEMQLDLKLANMFNVSTSVLHITPHNVSKGIALKELIRHQHWVYNQIIAIGDGDNDFSLFSCADYKVAMKNSSQLLLNVANRITDSNDENGVSNIINYLEGYV